MTIFSSIAQKVIVLLVPNQFFFGNINNSQGLDHRAIVPSRDEHTRLSRDRGTIGSCEDSKKIDTAKSHPFLAREK